MKPKTQSPESVVREIKRKTRRKFKSEEKIRIILKGLRGEDSISAICRREGIAPSVHYKRRYMRYSQSEKVEVIRIVESSPVSIKQTLAELNINRSTFYKWYRRYQEGGYDALASRCRPPKQFWNAVPPWEKQRVVETALEHPEMSPRELACYITDKRKYYISESTVYRILKAHGLITSPVYMVVSALDKFPQPTKAVNELWQTDLNYLKVVHWGCITCPKLLMTTPAISWPGVCVRGWQLMT